MKYKVQVVMSYWQTIEVDATSKEEAGAMAFDLFDSTRAFQQGDGEIYDIELIGEAA